MEQKENEIYIRLESFQHNVLCRNFNNQMKASMVWIELKELLPAEDVTEIFTEWSHYNNNEITTECFGEIIKKVKMKYNKK